MRDRVHEAFTYCATITDPGLKPLHWYRHHVLYCAREHGLPADYIAAIERVEAIRDKDVTREMGIYAKD